MDVLIPVDFEEHSTNDACEKERFTAAGIEISFPYPLGVLLYVKNTEFY
jgi:hypothetical protein